MKTAKYKTRSPMPTCDVLVAILTGYERHFWIHPDLLHSCLGMPAQLRRLRAPREVIQFTNVHGVTPVDAARNIAVKRMMESRAEWLLQIDNDVVPHSDCLKVLDDIGERKIVGFPCSGFHSSGRVCLCLGTKLPGDEGYAMPTRLSPGWQEEDFVGSGCLLVHRSVFESLDDPWFECMRDVEHQHRLYAGEDTSFCEKAKGRGFSVWTHSSYPARHYHTAELMQMMADQVGTRVVM